jgi:hypothetical protein
MLLKNMQRKLRLLRQYAVSGVRAPEYHDVFEGVETYCMFIGYPRSGHTLVGSLLDAHPEIVVGNELNTMRYIRYHFRRDQLYWLLLENTRRFSQQGRWHTDYLYAVPGQWQGRYKRLRVIGDKRGSGSVKKIYADPRLYQRLVDMVGVPIRTIHVIRNTFDNISTIFLKGRNKNFQESIDYYFFLAEEVSKLKKVVGERNIIELHHEDLIRDVRTHLQRLTAFLGVTTTPDYLDACSSIVFSKPHLTRNDAPWTDKLIKHVSERMRNYPFLAEYAFDN